MPQLVETKTFALADTPGVVIRRARDETGEFEELGIHSRAIAGDLNSGLG